MICIVDSTTDPYWNLAAEEYLLTALSEPVFRLWRNAPSVIVGRYQNAAAEINSEYVRTRGIPVVRRLTGGGAVFHDLGNVNYTFIDRKVEGEDTAAMFRRFTAPVISALRSLGVEASLEGRNDLVISGRKFSGNAVCVHGGRVLQHGTLLFSASVADLSGALNTRPEKFIGKSVQSNRSRVTNISEHLPARHRSMSVEEFITYLQDHIAGCTDTLELRQFPPLRSQPDPPLPLGLHRGLPRRLRRPHPFMLHPRRLLLHPPHRRCGAGPDRAAPHPRCRTQSPVRTAAGRLFRTGYGR